MIEESYEIMFQLIVDAKYQFCKLFMDYGINIKEFMKVHNNAASNETISFSKKFYDQVITIK